MGIHKARRNHKCSDPVLGAKLGEGARWRVAGLTSPTPCHKSQLAGQMALQSHGAAPPAGEQRADLQGQPLAEVCHRKQQEQVESTESDVPGALCDSLPGGQGWGSTLWVCDANQHKVLLTRVQ